ncbi:MAG: SDR family NAD(P)-dependent oxidoreductase, partial [Bacteroidales bacterium]|nr:SDR family NAD(P)-dependent oxidoreductase [Bacteroidales bacterium]
MGDQPKTVCITGAAKGIGKAIAQVFAKNQANVLINYNSSKEHAAELRRELEATGCSGKIEIYGADVTDFEQVMEMFRYIKKEFGGLDVLVNNAGITSDQYLMLMKNENWLKVIDTNLNSVFYCSKAAVPLFIEKR